MILGKEAAIVIAAVVALIQGVLIFVSGNAAATVPEWVVQALTMILTMLAGVFVRSQVASRNTVNEAGYTMGQLEARAESPAILPAKEA